MGFSDILGQMLQEGLGGQTQTRGRVDQSMRNLGQSGGGLDDIFGQLQGALTGAASGGQAQAGASGGLGGLAELAKNFLGKEQIGGLSTGQVGGIGAAAGALLGGGVGGAAKGGLLAVLGTMALGALKGSQKPVGQTASASSSGIKQLRVEPQEVAELTSADAERVLVKAMISAAKSDGKIDQDEVQKIIGKIKADDVTEDEKQFVMAEMRAPLDIAGLAADVRGPAQAAQVYAASLLAIDIDTRKEQQYLRDLSQALRMAPQTVAQLHQMTGAPTV
jgi:uncharacterized membrane protein YebE (DUF533 family)